jgi:hypothetical protein
VEEVTGKNPLKETVFGGNDTAYLLAGIAIGVATPGGGGKAAAKVGKELAETGTEITVKKGDTFFRVMSKKEKTAIEETGFLRGGDKGKTHFTDGNYSNANRAKQRLALEKTPEISVKFKLTEDVSVTTGRVEEKAIATEKGMLPGGGWEFHTKGKVPVEIINNKKLK